MRTTMAEKAGYVCPKCGDRLSRDRAGKGYVRHLSNAKCRYQNGTKDAPVAWLAMQVAPHRAGDVGSTLKRGASRSRAGGARAVIASRFPLWRL